MSKTKLLLDLVGSIRSLAEDLQAIADCMCQNSEEAEVTQASSESQPNPIPQSVPSGITLQPNERLDTETGEIIRLDLPALRTAAAAKAQTKEQKEQMRALLKKHGVTKLTELPLSDYFDFQKEVAAIE